MAEVRALGPPRKAAASHRGPSPGTVAGVAGGLPVQAV